MMENYHYLSPDDGTNFFITIRALVRCPDCLDILELRYWPISEAAADLWIQHEADALDRAIERGIERVVEAELGP